MSRTVYVTGGAVSLRSMSITETTGQDISADAVVVALLPYGQRPASTDGAVPDQTQNPSPDVTIVSLLVDNRYAPGAYRMWARITDTPENDWLEGGVVNVE